MKIFPLPQMCEIVGTETASHLRDLTLRVYKKAADYARQRGIIIADTKFEFGMTAKGITLADEVLTPDSSRFWPADKYSRWPRRRSPTTSNTFAITSRKFTGTNSHPRPRCRPRSRSAPARNISTHISRLRDTNWMCKACRTSAKDLAAESGMTPADWLIVLVIVLNVILAAMHGFFAEALSMAGLVVGYIVAAWQYQRLAEWLMSFLNSELLAEIFGFLIIFFVDFDHV